MFPMLVEKTIFKFRQCILAYFEIVSLLKKAEPFIWRNLIPITKGCIVPSLVEIDPVILEKIFEFCQYIFAIS